MNAVPLMMEIVQQGGDLSATMREWMDKSEKSGWPKTDVGWHRWVVRKLEVGDFPKLPLPKSNRQEANASPPPEGFADWFKSNPEALDAHGKLILTIRQAWMTQRYRSQWEESRKNTT